MSENKPKVFHAETVSQWRKWLEKNHVSEDAVWLVFHKKSSDKKSITWSESVDVALCFGWIDSKKIKVDEETSHQFFSKRKAKSTWSKINKDKIDKLIGQNLMTPAGYKSIEIAKENGSWTILDEVEDLIIPDDLDGALKKYYGAHEYFLSLSKSVKKMMLYWIVSAKRPETRQSRISQIAEAASKKMKPKQFL
ncbi:YdeI/OmpD-associated family protein [Chryseobacterium foetidum]|uniref:YdeI/OmpD-associated family protein n=1 Tax=Chryseobacterium foetidum TaxID=2951057 RepID=UPI0021C81AE5|nr:YdeI/OmpD-associated family protein [Chryseobacterium foetidum]